MSGARRNLSPQPIEPPLMGQRRGARGRCKSWSLGEGDTLVILALDRLAGTELMAIELIRGLASILAAIARTVAAIVAIFDPILTLLAATHH